MAFGDLLQLSPMQGKRRNYPLKRTCLRIEMANLTLPVWKGASLKLQACDGPMGAWEMRLIGPEREGRYFIEALSGVPFVLNGTPCLQAWPLRGDRMLFGNNLVEINSRPIGQREQFLDRFVSPQIVTSDLPILIQGETGTGKSSLAREIHQQSGLAGDFLALNLRAFNPQLLESELFGHVKGAFTGAIREKVGALASTQGGTLFLDEIDSLSKDIQTKLLLFLDTLEYRPVGGERNFKAQTRMIFAAGNCMRQLVRQNLCRADFYFRISQGAVIQTRPLRESRSELNTALSQVCLKEGLHLCPRLREAYLNYHWPGNYRQLWGHLKRKKALANGAVLRLDEVDASLFEMGLEEFPTTSFDNEIVSLAEVKKRYIWNTYLRQKENLIQTALALKISKMTVKRIIKEIRQEKKILAQSRLPKEVAVGPDREMA